jgi:hypothetical protein
VSNCTINDICAITGLKELNKFPLQLNDYVVKELVNASNMACNNVLCLVTWSSSDEVLIFERRLFSFNESLITTNWTNVVGSHYFGIEARRNGSDELLLHYPSTSKTDEVNLLCGDNHICPFLSTQVECLIKSYDPIITDRSFYGSIIISFIISSIASRKFKVDRLSSFVFVLLYSILLYQEFQMRNGELIDVVGGSCKDEIGSRLLESNDLGCMIGTCKLVSDLSLVSRAIIIFFNLLASLTCFIVTQKGAWMNFALLLMGDIIGCVLELDEYNLMTFMVGLLIACIGLKNEMKDFDKLKNDISSEL